MSALEDTNGLVTVLSNVLCQLVGQNDMVPLNRKDITIFHAQRPPTISIKSYLERIVKYSPCSPECYVLALIYIDRIIQQNAHFQLTSLNAHRLLITSVLVASKYYDDTFYNNSYYSRVGGVSCPELNALELEFLFLINFSLTVSPETFNCYSFELTKHFHKAPVQPIITQSKERVVKRREEKKEKISKKQKVEDCQVVVLHNTSLPFSFKDSLAMATGLKKTKSGKNPIYCPWLTSADENDSMSRIVPFSIPKR